MKIFKLIVASMLLSIASGACSASDWILETSTSIYFPVMNPLAAKEDVVRYHYASLDIREDSPGAVISFDCEIEGYKTLDRGMHWYFGTVEFPFNGAPVEVDVYIDKVYLFTTTGRSTGTYEGSIYPTADQLRLLQTKSISGNILDVLIFSKDLGVEEHVVLSLKGFNPNHPTLRCLLASLI